MQIIANVTESIANESSKRRTSRRLWQEREEPTEIERIGRRIVSIGAGSASFDARRRRRRRRHIDRLEIFINVTQKHLVSRHKRRITLATIFL